jgi:hypothetical protein
MTQETHDLTDGAKLLQLVFGGFIQSQVIYVAVRLGIVDALAAGPKDAGALATATKAHAPTLRRLMRVLTALGLSDEDADGRCSLTPQGGCCARTSEDRFACPCCSASATGTVARGRSSSTRCRRASRPSTTSGE